LSTPDLKSLPSLPLDNDGPTFAEPWQAQAFGLVVRLSAEGHFTCKEWAAALAEELRAAADRGEPDDGSHYYEHWLSALERLVTSKGLTDTAALAARKEAWADAYRHTQHGQPVTLRKIIAMLCPSGEMANPACSPEMGSTFGGPISGYGQDKHKIGT
jgi:nitrile hydratase accessory protein